MSTFDSEVSKREIIEMQIEHTRLSFLDRQSSDYETTEEPLAINSMAYFYRSSTQAICFWDSLKWETKFC
jgi:hypothetical protein